MSGRSSSSSSSARPQSRRRSSRAGAPSPVVRLDAILIGLSILLTLAVLLGGGSRSNALRVAVVELAALPVLGLGLLKIWNDGSWRRHRTALALLAAVVVVPLLQLIPLPPALWTALPGRESAVLALELADLAPGWSPASLTPEHTKRSLLALIPPTAVLIAGLSLGATSARLLVGAVCVLTLVSVALGALQLLSGEPFYPWSSTTRGTVAGLFANRNHLATLCLMALPFCAALASASARRNTRGMIVGAISVGVLIVALALIRSRAGLTLAGPTLAASAAIAWIGLRPGRPKPALIGLMASVIVALTLVLSLGLGPILERFDSGFSDEARFSRWPLVAETAQAYLPIGAGIGAFDRVYRSVEPVSEVDETFFNQAHNDYLETWLEGGWLSVAVIIGLLAWFGRRFWSAWRAPPGEVADLRRAASVALLVVLAHSTVDYPLRTLTLLCMVALCAALLECAPPPARPGEIKS